MIIQRKVAKEEIVCQLKSIVPELLGRNLTFFHLNPTIFQLLFFTNLKNQKIIIISAKINQLSFLHLIFASIILNKAIIISLSYIFNRNISMLKTKYQSNSSSSSNKYWSKNSKQENYDISRTNCFLSVNSQCQQPHSSTQKHLNLTEKTQYNCQNYFLRKNILILYSYFEKHNEKWNLQAITYKQMLIILKELKYIRSAQQSQGSQNSQETRKCYDLWVVLSRGKTISLYNLLCVLSCIENLELDTKLIRQIVEELQKGIQRYQLKQQAQANPRFIYFTKKQLRALEQSELTFNETQTKIIKHQFMCFKYTRLAQDDSKIRVTQEVYQNHSLLSKKSTQLASQKRLKILQSIKLQHPNVTTIQLHHILSFKNQNTNKTQITETAKNIDKNLQSFDKKVKIQLKKSSIVNKENGNLCKKEKIQKKLQKNRSNTSFKKYKSKQLFAHQQDKKIPSITEQFQNSQSSFHNISTDLAISSIQNRQGLEDISWQSIPRCQDQIKLSNQLYNLKQDESTPSQTQTLSNMEKQQQNRLKIQKRKQYLQLPILYVDVNIDFGKKQRIIIYEGDKSDELALQFGKKHNLTADMIERLSLMLEQQIGSVLKKIDETLQQDCSDLY